MTGKRRLFAEIMEGMRAMQAQREGKITLRTIEAEDLPPLRGDVVLVRETREHFNVSRPVFARRLCVTTRNLENGERRRTTLNARAAALILMVHQYPDAFEEIRSLVGEGA